MSDVADRYRRLSTAFAHRVAAVPPEAWANQTPCEEWTARQLVGHVVDVHRMFLGLVGRELRPGPSVDDDPLGAFLSARDQVQADLDDPQRASAEYDGYFGRTTFADTVDRFLGFDLVVHGWDLARATGQDERIAPEDVQRVWADTEVFGDAMRSSATCGPALEPPPDADEQTRLLAYLGRQV
jgi:uncharacterized protein (TIGR03086 family)